jgi:hypothetical protein
MTYYGPVILFQDFSSEDSGLARAPSHDRNMHRITKTGAPIMQTGNIDWPYINFERDYSSGRYLGLLITI